MPEDIFGHLRTALGDNAGGKSIPYMGCWGATGFQLLPFLLGGAMVGAQARYGHGTLPEIMEVERGPLEDHFPLRTGGLPLPRLFHMISGSVYGSRL